MGRGRGGGGAGRSTGGGSGSRSFGGSSSHSHRGGSSSSGSRNRGGSASSYRYSTRPTYVSGPRVAHHHHYGPSYYSSPSAEPGPGAWLVTILVLIIFIFAVLQMSGGNVSKSTVEREKLEPYAAFDRDCVDDAAHWITNKSELLSGMESFYKDTGIQPALAIYEEIGGERYLGNDEIEDFMYGEYDSLIGHEQGLLVLFCGYADSDWYVYWMAGEDAQTVMDTEACGILDDYVHALYTRDDLSDEEFFSEVFRKTGDRIMAVTPTIASKMPMVVGGVVVIALAVIGLKALKAKHKRDAEKAKETERILNTPIDRI